MTMNKRDDIIDVDQLPAIREPEVRLVVDPQPAIRLGWLILIFGFGSFMLWAFIANLDEGIPSVGTVVVDSKRKTVQHQTGGVVESILVKDGDKVQKDQVLIRLVGTQSKANLDINKNQADMLKAQLDALAPLVELNYYPKNQYLDIKRQYDDAIARTRVAQEESDRTEIRAPVAGSVMGLANNTVGGVLGPGAKVLEIIPDNDELVVEAQIAPHLIDKIHAGLEADVRFSALNQRTTPVLSGKVLWVSADKTQDPSRPEISYFTARIDLSDNTLLALKGESLVPGMPADVIIKTGSRSFWSYLTKPLFDRAALSMKER